MYFCETELFWIEQIIYIKMDLALNNLQSLIYHKTQQTKPNYPVKSGPGSNGNEEVIHIPKILELESSAYSTVSTDRAI